MPEPPCLTFHYLYLPQVFENIAKHLNHQFQRSKHPTNEKDANYQMYECLVECQRHPWLVKALKSRFFVSAHLLLVLLIASVTLSFIVCSDAKS